MKYGRKTFAAAVLIAMALANTGCDSGRGPDSTTGATQSDMDTSRGRMDPNRTTDTTVNANPSSQAVHPLGMGTNQNPGGTGAGTGAEQGVGTGVNSEKNRGQAGSQ